MVRMPVCAAAGAEIWAEYVRACRLHGKMLSAHEGYAVLVGELDELKVEVFRRRRRPERMRREAVQVGAMALRFVIDVLGADGDE